MEGFVSFPYLTNTGRVKVGRCTYDGRSSSYVVLLTYDYPCSQLCQREVKYFPDVVLSPGRLLRSREFEHYGLKKKDSRVI